MKLFFPFPCLIFRLRLSGAVAVRKVIVITIVCVLLISGLIVYDFSRFNSDRTADDIETEARYGWSSISETSLI